MKNKLLLILAITFVAAAALLAFTACNTNEQSLDGLYIVTFEFNGGILDTGATNVEGSIFHAYEPNQYAIDINAKFQFRRTGYKFDGWFKDENLTEEWNFETDRVTQNLTLYAKWSSEIVYSYTLYLVDGTETTKLGSYNVEANAKLDDNRGYGTSLSIYDKTFLGYYSDKELTKEWNGDFTHPGGKTSLDIPVYVKAMDGVWSFVSNYDELKKALGSNIWLTDNVDCGGSELFFGDSQRIFGGKINGNGFVISNFVIQKNGSLRNPEYTLFGNLSSTAKIENVGFAEVQIKIDASNVPGLVIKTAALAVSAEEGCVINNVSVSGTYENNSAIDVSSVINNAFYQNSTVQPNEFTANFVAKVS